MVLLQDKDRIEANTNRVFVSGGAVSVSLYLAARGRAKLVKEIARRVTVCNEMRGPKMQPISSKSGAHNTKYELTIC